jgi:ornithine cyclodeaminase/alanine dehydrogenase-like protein (mu-crystallin family)
MGFIVLSEADVNQFLNDITATDVDRFACALSSCLQQYSCGNEQQYQPHRGVVTKPDGQVSLFMPATTHDNIGVKIVGIAPTPERPVPAAGKPITSLRSALTICDAEGRAIGIINAAELTAFRTALGSMFLYRRRKSTSNIVVFGAGRQAFWHIRLAVLLRGKDISNITIVNRSAHRTQQLVNSLTGADWPAHISVRGFEEADANRLEHLVVDSDVIFCGTPSTQALFPAAFLTSEAALSKTRFISAIGSYRLDMAEIDPDLIRAAADPSGVFASQTWQGCIAVDSREGCLQEAGELVASGIASSKMLESGYLHSVIDSEGSGDVKEWIESGFVIYKSVGIGNCQRTSLCPSCLS